MTDFPHEPEYTPKRGGSYPPHGRRKDDASLYELAEQFKFFRAVILLMGSGISLIGTWLIYVGVQIIGPGARLDKQDQAIKDIVAQVGTLATTVGVLAYRDCTKDQPEYVCRPLLSNYSPRPDDQ